MTIDQNQSEAAVAMLGALNPRSSWAAAQTCPVAHALDELSTKTTFLLVREAFYGATRFDEFVERTGVSEPVAAARLKELVASGILERVPYQEPGKRTRAGYRLTEKGTDLLPVLVAMMRWGDRWVLDGGARVELTHRDCGAQVSAQIVCDEGHQVGPGDLGLKSRARVTEP